MPSDVASAHTLAMEAAVCLAATALAVLVVCVARALLRPRGGSRRKPEHTKLRAADDIDRTTDQEPAGRADAREDEHEAASMASDQQPAARRSTSETEARLQLVPSDPDRFNLYY